jgi:hypothetical protein
MTCKVIEAIDKQIANVDRKISTLRTDAASALANGYFDDNKLHSSRESDHEAFRIVLVNLKEICKGDHSDEKN